MKLLTTSRKDDQISRPWKNGGGKTIQLCLFPLASSFENETFRFRVSRAEIDQTGPFSQFPGYDRGLMQLTGEPLRFGHEPTTLFEPFLFPGEKKIQCTLKKEEEATDIGILIDRNWGTFKMSHHTLSQGSQIWFDHYADFVGCFAHEGHMKIAEDVFGPGEFALLERDDLQSGVFAASDLTLILIEIRELKQP